MNEWVWARCGSVILSHLGRSEVDGVLVCTCGCHIITPTATLADVKMWLGRGSATLIEVLDEISVAVSV